MATISSNYVLTIQLALDGLSFALFDHSDNKLTFWNHCLFDGITNSEDLLTAFEKVLDNRMPDEKKPDSVKLIIGDRVNVIVPEAVYNANDSDKYLSFCFDTPKGFVTQAETIKRHEAVNVFAFPEKLKDIMRAKWPEAIITHSSSVFLESLERSTEVTVHVNVRSGNFDVAIMKDKLLFFNNFRFNDKNDFAYFFLNVLEQHHLSGEQTTVVFSGLIQPSSEIIDLCRRYVKDIRFVEQPDALQINGTLREVPYPYYHIHYIASK